MVVGLSLEEMRNKFMILSTKNNELTLKYSIFYKGNGNVEAKNKSPDLTND